jgi:protein-L-isoaspartate(D-aspartate) O-methyltransferase
MADFNLARHNMVESQIRTNKVTDSRIVGALRHVPRHLFVAPARQSLAYADEPLALGGGRFLAPPMLAARLYQAAQLAENDLVLVVGSGTGYGAAVLGRIVSAVVALEQDPDLAATARKLLENSTGELSEVGTGDNVILVEGPLAAGWPKQAPYDAILFEGAVESVPETLTDQLALGGRLLAVVREAGRPRRATNIRRTAYAHASTPIFDAMLPMLPGFARVREFAL